MRFARKIDFNLKSGKETEFNKVFESKIVPILKKQTGFQDELLLTTGHHVTAISLWDTRQHAEGYEKAAQPKVFETLEPFFETKPKIQTCDVPYSTMHAVV